jgi:hypothetical protein
MEVFVVAVITISSIVVVVGGFIYCLCTKKAPMQETEFSFDDVYKGNYVPF